jgi:polyphosphate kinase
MVKIKNPYIHRDISWLSFNYRVLQEAMDVNVPLFERLKFLAIYSSNLDEFFRVRVANHKNLLLAGKKTFKNLEFSPKVIIREVLNIVNTQQLEFSNIFHNNIIPELKSEGIDIVQPADLRGDQLEFLNAFFDDNVLPYTQPIVLMGNKIKPFLLNGALYLSIIMKSKTKGDKEKYYAIVKIPSEEVGRFIVIPNTLDRKCVILLDDIVRFYLNDLFPGFTIVHSYSIKLTRDAELYIDDEYGGDLVQKIKKSIQKRNVGSASRLVIDRKMPQHMLENLMLVFDLNKLDVLEEGQYHSNSDFMNFPTFGMNHLKNISLEPVLSRQLMAPYDIFDAINQRDHLLYFPYHSYEPVIRFFEEASIDNTVTHIKIFQYRVAKDSKVMKALMKAANNGKQVTVFIEVKARFDEENNIDWGERLEQAGVRVLYSIPGIKVHSKIALIRKVVKGKENFIGYLSTGNFNEKTAELYCDFGLFTANKKLIDEVLRIFRYVETKERPTKPFKVLGVGTFNLKDKFKELVQNEIDNANKGQAAYITLKMNSLQDGEMIDMLYTASQAGVKIKLIVRGICCIVAGINGISENIECISIVDRFLEHSRVYIFGNNGDELIYLSSADWMVRNLHYRIEATFPILNPDHKQHIKTIMKFQLNDNVKARLLDFENSNEYKRDDGLPVRSQYDTYYYIKRREDELS